MKEQIKQLFKSNFIRNVVIMATGAAGAQVVTLLLTPIITRLYGPGAFGIMGTFTAMMNIMGSIAALTYPVAMVLPKNDQNAKGIARLSLIVTVTISMIALILIVIFDEQMISIFNLKEISSYLYLIPFIIIFAGFMQVAEQWLIRTKQFTVNARATFYQSLLINSSKTLLGFFYPQASVLVILTSLNNGVRAFFMVLFSKGSSYKSEIKSVNEGKKPIKSLAKTYYDFPMYRAPETFINAMSQGLPVLMLSVFFGPTSAGFYTIGKTTLSIPERLIGKSVGDVFYPRITEAANNKEDVAAIIKKATFLISGVGLIPFGLVIFFGPYLFSLVFGNDWVIAGEYARWIALWSYTRFANRPSVRSLPALNALRFNLIYTIITLITGIIALVTGYYIFSSDVIAVALFGISGALLHTGIIFITLKFSNKRAGFTR